MFRYPDSTYRQEPPAKIKHDGLICNFVNLTREQWDELGYNEAVPLKREEFTAYTTEWEKGDDLIYREVIITTEVDEEAKARHEAEIAKREKLEELDKIDAATVRPLRAVLGKMASGSAVMDLATAKDEDLGKLSDLEERAKAIRATL